MNGIKELFKFIRIKLSFPAIFLPLGGFLLFNQASFKIIFISLSAFFACSTVYAFNNLTDKKEDRINKRHVSRFAENNYGKIIILACALLGGLSALFLTKSSILFYVLFLIMAIAYSFFRIKEYFLIKNIYTMFSLSVLFLFGASASHAIGTQILIYYPLLCILILSGTIISDLRDYKGDKDTGIRTLPVLLGLKKTVILIHFLLLIFLFPILFLRVYEFFIFLPLPALVSVFLLKKDYKKAHMCGGIFCVCFVVWLLVI